MLENDDPLLPMDVDLQEEENDDGWETDENIEQPQARRQLFERNADNAEGILYTHIYCFTLHDYNMKRIFNTYNFIN